MQAILQENNQGIDSIKTATMTQPTGSLLGTLVNVNYVPVLPWDMKGERGELGTIENRNLPHIIGYGFAGTKYHSNSANQQSRPRLMGAAPQGSYAEVINASIPFYTFKVPDNVTLPQAATVIGGADTALMMIEATHVTPTTKVLVLGGSGGIGTYLIQLLNNLHVQFSVLSSVRSVDFTRTIRSGIDVHTDLNELNDDAFDLILDTTGSETLLNAAANKVVTNGLIFTSALPFYRSPRPDVKAVFKNRPLSPAKYQHLLKLISTGQLTPMIDKIFPLDQVREAQHYAEDGPSRGRVLVEVKAEN
ncbi:zinc-binding dehydrogenase [Lactiplantibacillus herbarum]|uniref:zinc-binding dehydrogenase n=1 Tax=Lactiplantibacillus herbarum TaxID=1670446 RepID=UPI00069F898E|nr:zinc-binding dehydrogenase [Lactiplantibacillus herbarum]